MKALQEKGCISEKEALNPKTEQAKLHGLEFLKNQAVASPFISSQEILSIRIF